MEGLDSLAAPASSRWCSIQLTRRTPISLNVHPLTRFANSLLNVLAVWPSALVTSASNHLSCSISAEPISVKRAELRACEVDTSDSCEPAAKRSSTTSACSLGL